MISAFFSVSLDKQERLSARFDELYRMIELEAFGAEDPTERLLMLGAFIAMLTGDNPAAAANAADRAAALATELRGVDWVIELIEITRARAHVALNGEPHPGYTGPDPRSLTVRMSIETRHPTDPWLLDAPPTVTARLNAIPVDPAR